MKESDVFKEHINLAGLPGTFIQAQQSACIQHILKMGTLKIGGSYHSLVAWKQMHFVRSLFTADRKQNN